MANLQRLFKTDDIKVDDETKAFEELKSRSMYPELIGKMAPEHGPSWMSCRCGMLVITTAGLAGEQTVCRGCRDDEEAALGRAPGRVSVAPPTMGRNTERRVLFGLVAFVLLVGSVVGSRFVDAPPRAQATDQMAPLD